MGPWRKFWMGFCIVSMLAGSGLPALGTGNAYAADDKLTVIEVELTESFYRALRAEGSKTYRTNTSEEYLRQIAISSRYAVESNLKILERQKRIIELLEEIRDQKK